MATFNLAPLTGTPIQGPTVQGIISHDSTSPGTNDCFLKEQYEKKDRLFEVHIAAPQMSPDEARIVFTQLTEKGISKHKYFLSVYDVPCDKSCPHPLGSPPTGHDLDRPGAMSTTTTRSYEAALTLVTQGMTVLERYHKQGNFEIEMVISDTIPDYQEITIPQGFQKVDDSPDWENHIIFRGTLNSLPANENIINFVQASLGVRAHQIVDFSAEPNPGEDTKVSRVATIYQPSREDALRFAKRLREAENFIGYSYFVTEQVCLVGEPLHRI